MLSYLCHKYWSVSQTGKENYKRIAYLCLCGKECVGYAPTATSQWRDLQDNYLPSPFLLKIYEKEENYYGSNSKQGIL